ncbi:MAG: hypothetical protein LC732_00175 [Acidobacteria bacterium]|nr:hypothetical protein [Acidobacteriota bacterium]
MADDRIPPSEAAHDDVHHEQSDVNVGAILWWAVGLVLFAIAAHVGVYGHFVLLRNLERDPDLLPVTMVKEEGPKLPPAPRLQPFPEPDESGRVSPLRDVPPREMAEMRRDEQQHLSSYGWANPATKTVRVPIDRAIDLQLQKGFPVATPAGEQATFTGDGPAQPIPTPDMTQPTMTQQAPAQQSPAPEPQSP